MAKKVVIIIDYDGVRVVFARESRKNVIISNTLSFKIDELESFLKKEKQRDFSVVFNFKNFYSDIIYIPVLKGKHLKNVLRAEVKKKFPELKNISFLYNPIGETIFKGKKRTEVFIYAVDSKDIDNITNIFTRYNKNITHFVPIEFAMAMAVEFSEAPILCVTRSDVNKHIFLLREGKIVFIREVQGLDSGMHDFDVENINMTINYLRQNLRVNPAQLFLLGRVCSEYDARAHPIIPLTCLNYCPPVLADKKTIITFMSAIALFGGEDKKQQSSLINESNILPLKYKIFLAIKKTIAYSTALFLTLLICGSAYLTAQIFDTRELERKIDKKRGSMKNIASIISNYHQKKSELQQYVQLINITNRLKSKPNSQKLMIALSTLETRNISIKSITINPSRGSAQIILSGNIDAPGFNEIQVSYENFIKSLDKIEGLEISSKKMEMETGSINIMANYHD